MKPILDDPQKQKQVLRIIRAGCSRHLAAKYIGCDERTIRNYANDHPEFAKKLRQSELKPAIGLARTALQLAIKERNVRMLIYFLDRLCPDQFTRRRPGSVTVREMQSLMGQVGDELCRLVPDEAIQTKLFHRLEQLVSDTTDSPEEEAMILDAENKQGRGSRGENFPNH